MDRVHEVEFPKARGGGYTVSCKGMARSAVGPAGPDGKWECPVCGRRVGVIKTGYLKMHRSKATRQ